MAAPNTEALEYYAQPGRFTKIDLGAAPPTDIAEIVNAVQNLLVYDTVAKGFYGVDLDERQAGTINERDAAAVVQIALEVDPTPLGSDRPPECRVGGRCHLFTKLAVSFMRAASIPARARCGFGTHFAPGWFEDHWVAEYWNADAERWQMVDAQLDATWREAINYRGDPLNTTAAEFMTAGHAWQAWRKGEIDADRCGLTTISEHGAFWIAGNLRLDLAALNKVEMLPWDDWGASLPDDGSDVDADVLALFDAVAELTTNTDEKFAELREMYDTNDQLRMMGQVFNVNLGAMETVGD